MSFVGEHHNQLDAKGRVTLPADFRKEADGTRFVLLSWESTHLTLLPHSVWERVLERFLEYRRTRPGMANRLRRMMARASHVEPDKQGRILIPAALKEAAELDRTVVLLGSADRIEIWDEETYARVVFASDDQDDAGAAEYAVLEREIFG